MLVRRQPGRASASSGNQPSSAACPAPTARLAGPPAAGEEEVHPLVDPLPVAVGAVHRGERHQVVRCDGHTQLLHGLAARRHEHRLVGLHVSGGGRRPVPVPVAGAAAQLQQHLVRARRAPQQQDVGGRDDAVPHGPPSSARGVLALREGHGRGRGRVRRLLRGARATLGSGVLVFQEIFGINDNIRGLAERLAEAGFLVLVPDMFWRIEPRFERKDESGMADGMQWCSSSTSPSSATTSPPPSPTCARCPAVPAEPAASGSASAARSPTSSRRPPGWTGRGRTPSCPTTARASTTCSGPGRPDRVPDAVPLRRRDPYIPTEQIDAGRAGDGRARRRRPSHRYDAGHAFSNWDAPSMYDETAAGVAWDRTLDFLARHLR